MNLYEALLRVGREDSRMQQTGDTFTCFPLAKYFLTYICKRCNVNTLQMLGFHFPLQLKVPHSITIFSVLYWKLEIAGAQASGYR